jgi:hypothetical protein
VGRDARAREEAQRRWSVGDGLVECGRFKSDGGRCQLKAGRGTDHEGYGPCATHGGNSRRERKIGAWMMARRFGDELQVTPWDALLVVLRRAAAKAAWYAQELATADESELLPGGEHFPLVREAERADSYLAKYAKMALDAGVAEKLVQSVTDQAAQLVRVLNAAVLSDALGLSDEQIITARRLMAREMRVIDAELVGIDAAEDETVASVDGQADTTG